MLNNMATSDNLHFHCFQSSDLDRLTAICGTLEIRAERPSRVDVAACTVAPLKYRGKKNSGVYDRNYRLVAGSERIRDHVRVEGELDPRELRGAARDGRDAYYLGSGDKHYGHFLLEVLCRAWAWQEHGRNRVGVLQLKAPGFAKALYSLVPELLERTEIVGKPTRFRSMVVPGATFIMGQQAHIEFKRMCEQMAVRAMRSTSPRTAQPLYLSRSGLDQTRRALLGESRLERLLEKEGFLIIRPESLSVNDQISLFNRHEWIVSPTGSACHSRVFSCRPNNFVTITPAYFHPNHMLCDLLCDGSSHYVNALLRPEIGSDVRLKNLEPLLIDQENLLIALKGLGLVRPSAAFEGAPPDLTEYKHRWLAAARWLAKEKPPELASVLKGIKDVSATLDAGERRNRSTMGALASIFARPFRRD